MTNPFRPTPPADSAVQLRAVRLGSGQVSIRNGPGSLGGEFDRYYVELSGYCGEHNPSTFAAAPKLLAALEHILSGALSLPRFAEQEARAAIAEAHAVAEIDGTFAALARGQGK